MSTGNISIKVQAPVAWSGKIPIKKLKIQNILKLFGYSLPSTKFFLIFSNKSIETGIRVEFGNSQILENTDYVTYNIENFVSDIGGLAGLFLGFSLLSLYELILKVLAMIRNLFRKITSLKDVQQNKKWGNRDTKRYRRRTRKNLVAPEIKTVDVKLESNK